MLHFVAGNLLDSREQFIAQGVAEGNQEGLGTGLAFAISKRWPDVQSAFKKHARSGRFRGGDIWTIAPDGTLPGFIYLATQPDMYHATLPYLRKSLRNLVKWCETEHIRTSAFSLALPKTGSGLGKLDWDVQVKPLFTHFLSETAGTYVVYEDYSQARDG